MKNLLIILSLFLLSITSLFAEELEDYRISIEHSVYTKHVDYEDWMNEDNQLLGLEVSKGKWGVNVSKFVNTYGNDTKTLGVMYRPFESDYFEFDVLGGVVDGYDKSEIDSLCDSNQHCLYVAPRITFKYEVDKNLYLKTSTTLFGSAVIVTVGVIYKF